MNKTELWSAMVDRYPEFDDEDHILSQRAIGLRRVLEQAWDEGFRHGVEAEKAYQKAKEENPISQFSR